MERDVVRFEPVGFDEDRAGKWGDDYRLQTRSYELDESVRLFPEPEDVFADPVGRYAEHLDPLVSIELASVSTELAGWVHVVLPREPDLVGEHTTPFHNEYLSTNWIAFNVANDRYRLLGDFRYFIRENDPLPDLPPSYLSDWQKLGPLQQASYQENQQRYRDGGWDSFRRRRPHPDDNDGPLYQFKARAWQTNWQVAPPPPPAFRVTLSRPGDPSSWAGVARADGQDLVFIASVEPHRFRNDSYSGPQETLLFYDPVESIAVQTFDW